MISLERIMMLFGNLENGLKLVKGYPSIKT